MVKNYYIKRGENENQLIHADKGRDRRRGGGGGAETMLRHDKNHTQTV